MCGIAAIVDYAKIKPKVEDIKSMTDLLVHRGPDGEGFLIREGVALGHRRLAIIDTDARSNQPMSYEQIHLIFNGMIYNYIELRSELETLGYQFKTSSDTEVILTAYQEWKLDAFPRFNGMWAIVILDEQRNELICSRDRFGIKPMYYTEINNRFYIGSEIKAFTQVEGWNPTINHARLHDYLVHNMHDHTEETMFAGVKQLSKSHHMVINLDDHTKKILRYYDIQPTKQKNDGSKFKELFEDAVHLRMRTDVPLTCTLSGGMDSSSIVSVIAKDLGKSIDTFTLAYPGNKVDESHYAQMVNDKYNIPTHLVTTDEKFLNQHIDKLVYQQDEPFNGTTVMAQHHIYKSTNASGYKVMIGGQGGDEILCGYYKFMLARVKSLLKKNPFKAFTEMFTYGQRRSLGYIDLIQSYVFYGRRRTAIQCDWYNLKIKDQDRFNRKAESSIFDMSYNLLFELGISALLRYEDRNSMSYSVESRLPFLDYRLVEYCLAMKDSTKLDKGITKKILRESMRGVVPDPVLDRHDKMGFVTPQKEWMDGNKKLYLKAANRYLDKLTFINKVKILPMLNNDNALLWRIINTGKWIEQFKITA